MLQSNKEVISVKNKAYIAVLLSHLTVVSVLFTPIIRVTEIKMDILGQKIENSYFVNIIDYFKDERYSLTSVLMLLLTLGQLVGLANAIYGLCKKGYSHTSISVTFACSFLVALLGALHLYSKSYALFIICAVAFFVISFCSVKLIKAEK